MFTEDGVRAIEKLVPWCDRAVLDNNHIRTQMREYRAANGGAKPLAMLDCEQALQWQVSKRHEHDAAR
jgi:hypothetical protein